MTGARAKAMARRAAQVNAYRQLGGHISGIVAESYDGVWYTIKAF